MSRLAVDGGVPVRDVPLPYTRHAVDNADIEAVTRVLRSDWLTTGPLVEEFERAVAAMVGTRCAVAVSSGSAAVHAMVDSLNLGSGDEVIVPALTFVATANAVAHTGAVPVFADVDAETLNVAPAAAERVLTKRSRALIAVDFAGQACDYTRLGELAVSRGLRLLSDGCHALGGRYAGKSVGALAAMTAFSFHPSKHLTTAEGGMVTTDDSDGAARMRSFRNNGIDADHHRRLADGTWYYEAERLGYNYRLSDLQCALGLSQLRRLGTWLERRRSIAARYRAALPDSAFRPLALVADVEHAYHLFVVRVLPDRLRVGRDQVFRALRAEGIGVNVHYIPLTRHAFYRHHFGTRPDLCPVAEEAYSKILSLPIFPAMSDQDVDDVLEALHRVEAAYRR